MLSGSSCRRYHRSRPSSATMELLTRLSGMGSFVTIFLSILLLVCTCSSSSSSASRDYKNSKECNRPFNCGNIQQLSYPFRQRGDPECCGKPGFELFCEGGNPCITIDSQIYQVLVYNTTLKSLTLAPVDINNTPCPAHLATSLNLSPFHSAWNTRNLSIYYDCPTYANQYEVLSQRQFNCSGYGSGYFVITSSFSNLSIAAQNALRSCRSQVLVPAYASILKVLDYSPSSANLNVTLANGFGVQWDEDDSISAQSNHRKKAGMLSAENSRNRKENIDAFIKKHGSRAPRRYSYHEIKKMTNNLAEKLGQGGYGSVYKGELPDGCLVAVKVLSESKGNGEEFLNEVASISRTSHVNIVTLLGFCYEKSKRALAYEYMPNGSLDKFIYHQGDGNIRQLDWKTLYDIALGIARGLEYLHQGCITRILHFDIKPHNILLDENFTPKIADFGLSKLCESRKESMISLIGARGTAGYIAPEVFNRNFGGVSHKSDVYSYGIMVLEMVGGRKNIDVNASRTSEIYFPSWIYKQFDHAMNSSPDRVTIEEEEVITKKLTVVSLWCIQFVPTIRPSMTKVIEMLQGNVQSLEIPPTPSLSSPGRGNSAL